MLLRFGHTELTPSSCSARAQVGTPAQSSFLECTASCEEAAGVFRGTHVAMLGFNIAMLVLQLMQFNAGSPPPPPPAPTKAD